MNLKLFFPPKQKKDTTNTTNTMPQPKPTTFINKPQSLTRLTVLLVSKDVLNRVRISQAKTKSPFASNIAQQSPT